MASVGAAFNSTYDIKQLNPLQSHYPVTCDLQQVVCLSKEDGYLLVQGRWSHLKNTLTLMDV